MSRYIEFSKDNYNTYSIELAHLLLSTASEVDTVAKCVCKLIDSTASPQNINEYRKLIKGREDAEGKKFLRDESYRLSSLKVYIPRHGLEFLPWESWKDNKNPDWWNSYNKVKHERNLHFDKATLLNALHAVSALLVLNYVYCRLEMVQSRPEYHYCATFQEVTRFMEPSSTFARFGTEFYENQIEDLSAKVKSISEDLSNLQNWFKNSRS